MKINELSKEQTQWVVLGAIVGVFALYCVFSFGISPIMQKWTTSKSELEDLTDKLNRADVAIKNERTLRKETAAVGAQLADDAENHIPDSANTLSWVTQKIYAQAREQKMDLESVSPAGSGSSIVTYKDEVPNRKFDVYAVRVATEGSYAEILAFVEGLEKSNKYLTISGLTISSTTTSPETHKCNLDVQWPIWTEPDAAAQIRQTEDSNHG